MPDFPHILTGLAFFATTIALFTIFVQYLLYEFNPPEDKFERAKRYKQLVVTFFVAIGLSLIALLLLVIFKT